VPILFDKPEPGYGARRGPKRRWTIPPAPTPSWARFEGYDLIAEFEGAEVLPLFDRYRDTLLWAETDARNRRGLFSSIPESLPRTHPLHGALQVLNGIVVAPESADARQVAEACMEVSQWGAAGGWSATEYLFALLAAKTVDGDHELAFAAGRAARRQGRFEDAKSLFRRAIALSRRAGDDAGYASAFLGWAIMEEKRGNLAAARTRFVRALRAASRGGLPELVAATRHNMIALALADRDFPEGQAHIVAAYKLYGADDPQLYRLANDAAGFWSAFGYFEIALPLYERALPHVTRPDERIAILANISRAAAGLGRRERFLTAWTEAVSLDRHGGETMPDIYIELARGAQTLGYNVKAQELAREALTWATQRDYPAKRAAAAEMLAELQEGRGADPARTPPPELLRFARRFTRRLRRLDSAQD
jgi:tetratricopeptide (TPR) repeat protein